MEKTEVETVGGRRFSILTRTQNHDDVFASAKEESPLHRSRKERNSSRRVRGTYRAKYQGSHLDPVPSGQSWEMNRARPIVQESILR